MQHLLQQKGPFSRSKTVESAINMHNTCARTFSVCLSLPLSHCCSVCTHTRTHSPSYVFVRSPIAIFHEFFATSGENSETVKLTSNIQFLASWELIRTRMPAGCARRLLISRIRRRAAKLHLFSAYIKIVKKL